MMKQIWSLNLSCSIMVLIPTVTMFLEQMEIMQLSSEKLQKQELLKNMEYAKNLLDLLSVAFTLT